MNSFNEKIFYTILGTLKLSRDKFLELMEDLIQNQQYTEDEGKRISQELLVKYEDYKTDIKLRLSLKVNELKESVQSPIRQKTQEIIHDIKQKVQDYTIQQWLSK